jgi:tRNA/rRNA methyltransferase
MPRKIDSVATVSPLYNHLLPNDSQLAQLEVILVSPRNPLNIGAAARAMANFGLSRLTVVSPWEPHWPAMLSEVKSAVGAEDLLQDAKRTDTLAEAVADFTLVIGTGTVTYRKPEQPVVALPDLAAIVQSELERGGSIALVFGPEKHGLTREDLSYSHLLVEIPTQPAQPSMNLGQAVAVCLYELAGRTFTHEVKAPTAPQPATAGREELLASLIEELMVASDYSPAGMRQANRHDLRLLFRRLTLSDKDARRILGLLRRVLYKLRH